MGYIVRDSIRMTDNASGSYLLKLDLMIIKESFL